MDELIFSIEYDSEAKTIYSGGGKGTIRSFCFKNKINCEFKGH
jgi:hypothetical protein